ncbi:MAG: hypothetical protein Q7K38_02245 [Candidatus Wildermuthbacteria bacterium]|nr:hypothetical protein [Candidatus Wildermuthbacteria bacterium]
MEVLKTVMNYVGAVSILLIAMLFVLSLWDYLGDKKFQQLVTTLGITVVAIVVSLIVWERQPHFIILPLTFVYLGIGFLIQRNTFRIKVGDGGYGYSKNGTYHRRKMPDPSVSKWQRLGMMLLWGAVFPIAVWHLVENIFRVGWIAYCWIIGDTRPAEKLPPKEILPPEVRGRRRVKLSDDVSLLWINGSYTSGPLFYKVHVQFRPVVNIAFSVAVLGILVWWFFPPASMHPPLSALVLVYLACGFVVQRHVHRVKVGSKKEARSTRRRIPDPQVSLLQRFATAFFWGVEAIPPDLQLLGLKILPGLSKVYRWTTGDTEPAMPIPPVEIFPPEEQKKEVVQGTAVIPQNGHQGAATQTALKRTEELVPAGSSKN